MNSKELIKLTSAISFILPIGFVCFLALAKMPNFWAYFIAEQSPLAWLHSLMLYTVALFSFIIYWRQTNTLQQSASSFWVVLGFGFLSLSFDERFALHERIRDGFLAPREIKLQLFPWTNPGDFLLLLALFAAAAIIIIYRKTVWIELTSLKRSYTKYFKLAALFAVTSVLADSIPFEHISIHTLYVMQVVEEIFETLCFSCLIVYFLNRMTDAGHAEI